MKKYFSNLRGIIFIKIFTASLSILAAAFIPYITKMFIDYDLSKSDDMYLLIIYYFFAVVLYLFFERISQRYAWKLDNKYSLMIKSDIIKSFFTIDKHEVSQETEGKFLSILQNDIPFVGEKYVEGIVAVIQTVLQLLIYGVFLLYLDYRILIVVIILTLISVILPNLTSEKLSSKKDYHLSQMAIFFTVIKDHFSGHLNYNSKTKENINSDIYSNLYCSEEKKLEFGFYRTFTNIFHGGFAEFIKFFIFVLVFILLLSGEITKGVAVASIIYSAEFLFPLRYLVSCINDIKSSKKTMLKLKTILSIEPKKLKKLDSFESISLKNVNVVFDSFKFNINDLSIEKNKKYLITGENATGKSTIIKLLLGQKNASGKITINGEELLETDTSSLFSVISQEQHVYRTSFIENVTVFGTYKVKKIKLNERLSHLIDEIKETQNCERLSGGEKQVVSMLRSLNENKSLLIADEPTSAIDKNLEFDVFNTLLSQYSSALIVSHTSNSKIYTLFDYIINLSDGELTINKVSDY